MCHYDDNCGGRLGILVKYFGFFFLTFLLFIRTINRQPNETKTAYIGECINDKEKGGTCCLTYTTGPAASSEGSQSGEVTVTSGAGLSPRRWRRSLSGVASSSSKRTARSGRLQRAPA